jgi:hypothetical protein
MASKVAISIPQMPAFLKAIRAVPNEELKTIRRSLSRGVKRIRKNFIRTQLHGAPGIKGGKLTKGKNIFTFVNGSSLKGINAKIGISRILHVHEKGLVIHGKSNGMLYLHAKGGPVFAVVPSVTIPARLKFREQVRAEIPAVLKDVSVAATESARKTLQKGLLKGV